MNIPPFILGRSILNERVNAGVLQLTLGISIVISIICASMILLAYFSKLIILNYAIEDTLRDNALSGVQYGMAFRSNLTFNESSVVDLFGDETDSVEIIRKPWGVFEMVVSHAWRGTHQESKTALLTAMPNEIGKAIIYTPDNNAPIYLVGDARLEGIAYVSERKFSTGYINRRGFAGERLISGEVRISGSRILPIDTVLLSGIHSLVKYQQTIYSLNTLHRYPFGVDLSFHSPMANHFYSDQSIDISDSVSGNVIIQSGIKIRVTEGARLQDVILVAPDIDIDNGFEGNVQCFAERSITIGRDCKLMYPSALALLNSGKDSVIVIGENAFVEGIVIIPGFDQSTSGKGSFSIKKRGVLHGMAYINGTADIQGSIWGHITAKQFISMAGSSEYYSHIVDAVITDRKRSPAMPGSLLWANANKLVIAKWLE